MSVEKQLRSLVNAAQVLTSTLNVDEVLDQLITEVLGVIDGADAGVLFLYDERRDRLIAENAIGYEMQHLQKIHLAPLEGMTGKSFYSKRPMIFTEHQDVTASMEDLFPKYEKHYAKAVGSLTCPKSAVCAPMFEKSGRCIGVLTIVNFSGHTIFTSDDLDLLQTFANQSVIAIENATLFTQNERSKRLYETLSYVSLSGKGLQVVTETLADLIDQDVAVSNAFSDLLSYSSKRAKERATEMIKRPSDPAFQRFTYPIQLEGRFVGQLFVLVEDDGAIDSLDRFAIEQTTMIFALELASKEKALHYQYEQNGSLLQRWLDGNLVVPNEKIGQGPWIYVDLHLESSVSDISLQSTYQQSFRQLLYRIVSLRREDVFILEQPLHYRLLFTVTTSEKETLQQLEVFYETLYEQVAAQQWFTLQMGVGRLIEKEDELHRSVRDAARCIQYIQQVDEGKAFMTYAALGPYRLFLDHDPKELIDYVDMQIGPLLTYDKKQKTELFQTLVTYIDCRYNQTETAKASYVHVNTVKYRLQKIEQLLERSLDETSILDLQLAIMIYQFLLRLELS